MLGIIDQFDIPRNFSFILDQPTIKFSSISLSEVIFIISVLSPEFFYPKYTHEVIEDSKKLLMFLAIYSISSSLSSANMGKERIFGVTPSVTGKSPNL